MRVQGKVAFVTGAARGQGRAFAVALAAEGADVVVSDICAPVAGNAIPASTPQDLDETVAAVEAARPGTRVIARHVDVRNPAALGALAQDAVDRLGAIDVVVANAGILNYAEFGDYTLEMFQACIDTNLTGVFNTCSATIPHMLRAGKGGSVIMISSSAGLKGQAFTQGYTAAKHGVVGLCRALSVELGEYNIRVNSIHPAGVATPMGTAPGLFPLIQKHATTIGPTFMNSLPVMMMEPQDVAHAVVYLASEEAKFVTGLQMKVDAGLAGR